VRIRHAEPADHARVAEVIDEWWGGSRMRDMLPRLFFTHFRDTSFVADDDLGGLAGFLCGASPVNAGSLAFHQRLGFEIEAEVENYDGAGESRVLLVREL
jgi:RimJ/RimL family protein N-acetyltransferase